MILAETEDDLIIIDIPPQAAFIAFAFPSLSYVPTISTGSGKIHVLHPKFFLIAILHRRI